VKIQVAKHDPFLSSRAAGHGEIALAMWQRIVRVLDIGVFHGHDTIVLGAWGWSAFGNDANETAGLFERALQKNFKHTYRRVIFAITDWSFVFLHYFYPNS
jgi:uncharacterized protein (TIGR02452 family)